MIFCYVSATVDCVMSEDGTVGNEVSHVVDTAENGPREVDQTSSGTPPMMENQAEATNTSSTTCDPPLNVASLLAGTPAPSQTHVVSMPETEPTHDGLADGNKIVIVISEVSNRSAIGNIDVANRVGTRVLIHRMSGEL